jgi:hypothetical protein
LGGNLDAVLRTATSKETVMAQSQSPISIRTARSGDEPALRRLAALDSADPIAGPALVAEVDGELRAALSLDDQRVIADPFHATSQLVVLLEVQAAQPARRRAALAALRAAVAVRRGLVVPAATRARA